MEYKHIVTFKLDDTEKQALRVARETIDIFDSTIDFDTKITLLHKDNPDGIKAVDFDMACNVISWLLEHSETDYKD